MEVSRRILQKHLEPARPLRRCIHVGSEPEMNSAQAMMEGEDQQTTIDIEQFYRIVNLQKQKEGRISYTRDFLISLASCPEARKKPEFLPEHPIVLPEARDLGHLRLLDMMKNWGKEEMMTEELPSP